MNNIVIGRYLPLDSIIHRRDPRFKILSMMILLIAIFLPAGFQGYGLLAIFAFFAYSLSKLPFNFIWKAFKPMLFMMGFILVLNIMLNQEGDLVFAVWGIKIYSQALYHTGYIIVRLLLMLTITTILTASTKPMDLTYAIEDLMAPLQVFKVPSHEIAMIISIALRFIPTLIEEAVRIMKAQSSRGVDFEQGKLKEKIKGILSLIIPLFVASFKRAEDLANAMEARGYVVEAKRTRYRQFEINLGDWLMLIMTALVVTGIIFLMIL